MFESKSIGHLFFRITYFTTLLSFSVNNHKRFPSCPSLEKWIKFHITWLASWISLQTSTILSLLLSPYKILHNDYKRSSQYALYQTNELFVGAYSRETYWIGWSIFSFLTEAH
jgi:hypothetical protein